MYLQLEIVSRISFERAVLIRNTTWALCINLEVELPQIQKQHAMQGHSEALKDWAWMHVQKVTKGRRLIYIDLYCLIRHLLIFVFIPRNIHYSINKIKYGHLGNRTSKRGINRTKPTIVLLPNARFVVSSSWTSS